MKSLFKIVLLVSLMLSLVGCPSDDSSTSYDVRDRQEVYEENILDIEDYLKTHYMTLDANNNVEIDTILPTTTEPSLWNQTNYPLQSITVKNDTRTSLLTDGRYDDVVDYKLYYIKLNEGGGATPTSVDSTFVAYKGWNLENDEFDRNNTGVWFSYPDVNTSISGFRQILKTIKTAPSPPTEGTDGTLTYSNYGNVIVFVPSGLGYYSSGSSNIGAYASIAFQIKLFALKERNHDKDRVMSKYEDLNNNNDYFDDDTDGDKIPDFLDTDDDGDGFLTKYEVKKPTPFLGTSNYYPFNPSITEPKGIPSKDIIDTDTNEPDGTTPTRLRRHLDKNTKPPYTVY